MLIHIPLFNIINLKNKLPLEKLSIMDYYIYIIDCIYIFIFMIDSGKGGFMIIWGFRTRNNVMGQIQYLCPQCRQSSFHTVVHSRRWFTFFFIPIFPIKQKVTMRCNLCGVRVQVDHKQAQAWFPKNGQSVPQTPLSQHHPPSAPSPLHHPQPNVLPQHQPSSASPQPPRPAISPQYHHPSVPPQTPPPMATPPHHQQPIPPQTPPPYIQGPHPQHTPLAHYQQQPMPPGLQTPPPHYQQQPMPPGPQMPPPQYPTPQGPQMPPPQYQQAHPIQQPPQLPLSVPMEEDIQTRISKNLPTSPSAPSEENIQTRISENLPTSSPERTEDDVKTEISQKQRKPPSSPENAGA
jgi:hypothetical protein